MTVTYTNEVADCKGFGNFWRLLFRWRGSVYKLVWMDLLLYASIYCVLSVVYRVVLAEEQRRLFEKVSLYCNYFSELIPVSFVLGFYVSIVIKRWWDQYLTLPWPDSVALFVSTSIHGHDRQGRLMRRTILRYVNLSFILLLTMITPRAKKRFPTLDHMVDAGFMTANEKKLFVVMGEKSPHSLYYVPLVWAGTLVSRARREGRIRDDFAVKTIIDELNNLRQKIIDLISYDWISIPLVYTQVVSLAVYTFFLSTVMGSQFLDPQQDYPKNDIDFYFPVFTMLQFFFYMGWLKVAESLVNPFGEDDDDFEVNWLIDRNIQISYLIVDEMHHEHPELTQDLYWDEVFPQELPYTVGSEQYKREPPLGSTANLRVSEADQDYLPMLEEEEAEEKDAEGGAAAVANGVSDGTPTPGVRRIGSTRSFGSSMSGRKSSFMSMLQNKMRRGEQRNSAGSQVSVRRKRVRSASQSGSHVSDTSLASSAIHRSSTNVSLPESDIFNISRESLMEVNDEDTPIFFLSSSPKTVRKKVTLTPLPTIISSSSSSSSSPPNTLVSSPKDVDSLLIKVSHLQVEVNEEKGQDPAAGSIDQPGKDSPHITEGDPTTSTHVSIFGSQDSQAQEGDQRGLGVEGSHSSIHTATMPDIAQEGDQRGLGVEGSHSSIHTATMPDQEQPHLSKSEAGTPPSSPGSQGSVAISAAKEDNPPTEEATEEEETRQRGRHCETWQV